MDVSIPDFFVGFFLPAYHYHVIARRAQPDVAIS